MSVAALPTSGLVSPLPGDDMNEKQRKELLDRIRQSSTTIGGSIPETVELEDESVPLREFYFKISSQEELQPDDEDRVAKILTYLRRERLRLVQLIKNNEVDYESGKELVPKIASLERAINAFESVDDPSLNEQLRQEKIESAQELIDLMRMVGKK